MNTTRRTILISILATLGLQSFEASAQGRAFSAESFAQIRASHAGRPLIVHLWGMTCGPCLVELPKWGGLLRKRPHMHLVLIQVDQAPQGASEQTLRSAGLLEAEIWYVPSELDEFLRASIDPKWRGEMPRTLLISPGGEVARIAGAADLEQVTRWLDSAQAGGR